MPITRYKFSCNTERDLDIIQYLDSFSPEERRIVIKDAIRVYAQREELGNAREYDTSYDRLDSLEKKINDILREIKELQRKSLFTSQSNNDIINNDSKISEEDELEIGNNIMNLLED